MPWAVFTESTSSFGITEEEKDAMVSRLEAAGIPYRVEKVPSFVPGEAIYCKTHDKMMSKSKDAYTDAEVLAMHMIEYPGEHELQQVLATEEMRIIGPSPKTAAVRVTEHLRRK